MTEQSLNLRRSLQILRRHLVTLAVFTALGALAGNRTVYGIPVIQLPWLGVTYHAGHSVQMPGRGE